MSNLFFAGVPVRPDVERLMKSIDPVLGSSVSYDEVGEILGLSPNESRFDTVTTSWRKKLFRERAIQTKRQGGAIFFMTDSQAQADSYIDIRKIGRATGRHRVRVESINVEGLETEKEKEGNILLRRAAKALHEAAVTQAKVVALPETVKGTALRLAAGE